jgi:hypothetical protein
VAGSYDEGVKVGGVGKVIRGIGDNSSAKIWGSIPITPRFSPLSNLPRRYARSHMEKCRDTLWVQGTSDEGGSGYWRSSDAKSRKML